MTRDRFCPSCEGTGVCVVCHGGSTLELGQTCQCEATHECVDCYGTGDYGHFATEQMRRLRAMFAATNLGGAS